MSPDELYAFAGDLDQSTEELYGDYLWAKRRFRAAVGRRPRRFRRFKGKGKGFHGKGQGFGRNKGKDRNPIARSFPVDPFGPTLLAGGMDKGNGKSGKKGGGKGNPMGQDG